MHNKKLIYIYTFNYLAELIYEKEEDLKKLKILIFLFLGIIKTYLFNWFTNCANT